MTSIILGTFCLATGAVLARGVYRSYQKHGPQFLLHLRTHLRPPSELAGGEFIKGGFENPMTKKEAAQILGLREHGLQMDALKASHRRIMLLNHPDRGGSPYLASKINEAKNLLEKYVK